jgi:hypothetical protein
MGIYRTVRRKPVEIAAVRIPLRPVVARQSLTAKLRSMTKTGLGSWFPILATEKSRKDGARTSVVPVLSLGFSQAAVYRERGEITEALEFWIRIHPSDIGFPDFIGFAVDDENSAGRNLLDLVVKGWTDGGKFMDGVTGIESEGGVVEVHVKGGPGGKTGLKELRCEHFLRVVGTYEGTAETLLERSER